MGTFAESMLENNTPPASTLDYQPTNPALDLETQFAPLIKRLKTAGYTVSTHLRLGDPIPEILYFIATQNIDLVAMTTHAREGLSRLILGSVAADILHHIHVPVLLLHPNANTKQ
jgi:nucleotide-binding universal stress UspA family protein